MKTIIDVNMYIGEDGQYSEFFRKTIDISFLLTKGDRLGMVDGDTGYIITSVTYVITDKIQQVQIDLDTEDVKSDLAEHDIENIKNHLITNGFIRLYD